MLRSDIYDIVTAVAPVRVTSDSLHALRGKKGRTYVSTHGSHGADVRQSRLRSRWPRYTPSSDRYSVHFHTGTDQEHMEDSLWGDMMI